MNPQTVNQSEKSLPLALPLGIPNPYVTPPSAPTAADYAYRIALLTAGIVLLATVV